MSEGARLRPANSRRKNHSVKLMHNYSMDTRSLFPLHKQTAPYEEIWCNLLNCLQESVYSLGEHCFIPLVYWKERLQAAYFILFTLQTARMHKSGGICLIMTRLFHKEPNQWKGYLACTFCIVRIIPLWRFLLWFWLKSPGRTSACRLSIHLGCWVKGSTCSPHVLFSL